MIIDQEVEVLANSNRLKYYRSLGYSCNYGDKIKVRVQDLSEKSGIKIDVKCDYCGEIYKSTKCDLKRSAIKKDSCGNCRYKKIPECNLKKYGVTHPNKLDEFINKLKAGTLKKYGVANVFQVPEIREKHRKTILKKYGCENVFESEKVKKKSKMTNLKRYGVENVMQNKKISSKSKVNANRAMVKNNTVPTSKNQEYINSLYTSNINVLFKYYFVDMYFEKEKIYCEYDGSGHDLSVKHGTMTQLEFDKKEVVRYNYLKSHGLKMFRIVHSSKKLPSDEILLKIKKVAFELLLTTDNNWVVFDLDNSTIKTKEKLITL
jgi:very-short-patch-repair endonuclease